MTVAEELRRALITSYAPNSAIAESYRMLRTNILMQTGAGSGDSTALLVTSAGQGEGKSITCSNLGLVFAQSGRRVLIVDADLRLPTQHRIFGDAPLARGMRAALKHPLEKDVVQTSTTRIAETLDLLPAAGFSPRYPAEIIGSTGFADLISTVRTMYDIVLVDCPPVGVVTDAVVASQLVDGVLFVVNYAQTKRRFVERAMNELRNANANVLGTVLNRFPAQAHTYGSYVGSDYYTPQPSTEQLVQIAKPARRGDSEPAAPDAATL